MATSGYEGISSKELIEKLLKVAMRSDDQLSFQGIQDKYKKTMDLCSELSKRMED